MATAPPGCYLLLVLGQPCAREHKEHILRKIEEGLLSWDVEETRCDLLGLESVCSSLQASSEVENELLIQHSTENLAVEVLLNPHVNTLKQCLKNLLAANVGHKHVIHAGYAFSESGSWVLQDGSFSHYDFVDTLQDVDVQRALRRHLGCTVHVHCIPEGPWAQQGEDKGALSKMYESLYVNPASKVSVVPGSSLLLNCLDSVLRFQPLTEMMKSSPVVGNIRFNRPTLYVFPGGQGDCALFGVSGFTMLIDGGFNRKPCFWEFIRHLDRLDAIMITRLNENNVCGITNVVRRKQAGKRVYPQVGYVFCNVAEGKQSPTSPGNLGQEKDPLLVSVIQEGREFSENLQQLGLKPHRCLRDCQVEPLTLFHKVGHGTLEMYVLSPPKDSKEMKMFFQQWTSYKEHFSSRKYVDDREVPIPLSHAMSICALLVWKPADPADTITRVLLPGSAPQSKIFEGLEHLRHLEELRYRTCSQMSLGIKYEERVKIKTTRKHVVKSSIAKQKAEVTRPSSPMKSVRDIDEQMRLQRKRAESPVKLHTSSPVRRVKKSIKKVEDKKLTENKEDVSVKKSTKTVLKKIKKRSRSKSKEQHTEVEKDDNKSVEDDSKKPETDEVIEIEIEPLPASEGEKVDGEQDRNEEMEVKDEELEDKDKNAEDKSEEMEDLEVEDKSEVIEGKDKEIDSAIPEEEKLLLETEEREKLTLGTPEDEHSSLDGMKKDELEENKVESEEKDEDKDSMKSEQIKTDDKDEECPDTEIKTQDEQKVDETGEIQTEIPELQITTDVSSEQLSIEDEVKSQPGDEDVKQPSKDQKKDIETKHKSKGAVKKSKIISRTTSSSKSIASSSKSIPSPPKLLKSRKETDQKSTAKKDITLDRENKVKAVVKITKPKLKAAINVQVTADGHSKAPTPPSKLTIKAKESKQPSAIKEVKSSKTVKVPLKAESKLVKLEAKTEVKSKIAKDVVNKRVAESKNLAKQLELVKTKPPATLPKSPTKKTKVNLPLMSPKKKVKTPLAVAPTRTSKPSKDKTKPKPVKRPEKTKEVIPSAPEDATPGEKGPPTPPDELIPSPVPSPSEKSVEEEMVQDVPSSPKELQLSAGEIVEETPEKTPSETQEPSSPQEVQVEEKSPTVTESKDTETPEKEETASDQIFDEQMVVKEIEAVEAAMDELIEGIEESKAKSVSYTRDAQQFASQQKDIDTQEQVEIADLGEQSKEIGVSLEEVESVVTSPEKLKTIQTDPTWLKLKETLEPAIEQEISSITQSIKKEGINLDNYEIIIYEVIYEILIINDMPLTVEFVTKYIKESKKEITNAICKKYQVTTDTKESEYEQTPEEDSECISEKEQIIQEIVETSPTKQDMTTEVSSDHKKDKVIDENQFKEISVEKEPSKEITEKPTSPVSKDISSEAEEENAATDKSEVESIEEHIQSTKDIEHPSKVALETKITEASEQTGEGDFEEAEATKQHDTDVAEKESPELEASAEASPGPKEIDSEMTDKGEIEDASEKETTTKATIEDVSSPVQGTKLSKDETAETDQIGLSDVSEMEQPETRSIQTTSLDQEESTIITWSKLRESLEPAVQLEISFIKENIKNAGIVMDNYEIIIYDVILEILQISNISLTEESVTKYITENKEEIAKTICDKYQSTDEQDEAEDISDKNKQELEKQEALEQISPSALTDENELDDSKKVTISKVIEEESTEAQDEEKEILSEIEKSEETEKITKLKEPTTESEEGESSTEAVVGSKDEPSSDVDEKYKYIEDQLVEAVWSHEEEQVKVDIMECITPEIKNLINDLAKEIQVENVMVENLVEIIFQTLEEELRSKEISIGSSEIIQYVLEYRKEIICIVQQKLSVQESEGDRESPSEDKEIIEETITINNLKNYLTSEARDIISVITEELKIDGMSEDECEEMTLQTICEEIQNQNTPLETGAISQYIIKYRIHILTIIKTKKHYTEDGAIENENVLLPVKAATATEIISETKLSQGSENQKLDSEKSLTSTIEVVDESAVGKITDVESETVTIKSPVEQLKEKIISKSATEITEKSQAEQAEERAAKLDISDKIEDALSENIETSASPEEMDIKSPSIKGDELELEKAISSDQQDLKTPSDEIEDKSEEKDIVSAHEIDLSEEITVSTKTELELTSEKSETIIEKTTTPETLSEKDEGEKPPSKKTEDTTSKLTELQKESFVETTGAEELISKPTTEDAELKLITPTMDDITAEKDTTPESLTLKEVDSLSEKPDDKIVEKVVTPKSPTEKMETKSPSETEEDATEEISKSPTLQKVGTLEKTDEILEKAITPQSPIDSQEVKSAVDESDKAVGKDVTSKSSIQGETELPTDETGDLKVEKTASPSPTSEQIEILSSTSKTEDVEGEREILAQSSTELEIEIAPEEEKGATSEEGSPQETPTEQRKGKSLIDEAEDIEKETEITSISPTEKPEIQSSVDKTEDVDAETEDVSEPIPQEAIHSPEKEVIPESDSTEVEMTVQAEEVKDKYEEEIVPKASKEGKMDSPEKLDETTVEKIISPKTPTELKEVSSLTNKTEEKTLDKDVSLKSPTQLKADKVLEEIEITPKPKTEVGLAPEDKEDETKLEQVTTPTETEIKETESRIDLKTDVENETEDISKFLDETEVKFPDTTDGAVIEKYISTPSLPVEKEVQSPKDEKEIDEKIETAPKSPIEEKVESSDKSADEIVLTPKSPTEHHVESPVSIADVSEEKQIVVQPATELEPYLEKEDDKTIEKVTTPTKQSETKATSDETEVVSEEKVITLTSPTQLKTASSDEESDVVIKEIVTPKSPSEVIKLKSPGDKIEDETKERETTPISPSEKEVKLPEKSEDKVIQEVMSPKTPIQEVMSPKTPIQEVMSPKTPTDQQEVKSILEQADSAVEEVISTEVEHEPSIDKADAKVDANVISATSTEQMEIEIEPSTDTLEDTAEENVNEEEEEHPTQLETKPSDKIVDEVLEKVIVSESSSEEPPSNIEKDVVEDTSPISPIAEKHDSHETVIEELAEQIVTQKAPTEEIKKKIQSPIDVSKDEEEKDIPLELEKVTDKTDVTVEKITTPQTPIDQKEISKEDVIVTKSPTQLEIELPMDKEDDASVEKASTPKTPSDQKKDKSPVDKIESVETEEKITTKSPTEEKAELSDQITEAMTEITSTPQTPTKPEKDKVASETEEVALKSPIDIKVKSLPDKIDIPVDEKITISTDQKQDKTPIDEVDDEVVEKEITSLSPTVRKVDSLPDETIDQTVEKVDLSKTPIEMKEVTSSIDKIEVIAIKEEMTPKTPTKPEIDKSSVKVDIIDEGAAVGKEITPESITELKLESSVEEKIISPKSSTEDEKIDSVVTKEQEIPAKSPSDEKSTSEKDDDKIHEKSITPTTTEHKEVISTIDKKDEDIDDTQISPKTPSEHEIELTADKTDDSKVGKAITSTKTVEQGEIKSSVAETEDVTKGKESAPTSLTELEIESSEEKDETALDKVISPKTPLAQKEVKSTTDVGDTVKEKEAIPQSPTELKTESSDKPDESTVQPTTPSEKKEASSPSEAVTYTEADKVSTESPTQQKPDSPDKKDVAEFEVTDTKTSIDHGDDESLVDEVDDVTGKKEDTPKSPAQIESTGETEAAIDTKPISPMPIKQEIVKSQIDTDNVIENKDIPESPSKLELDTASSEKDDVISQKITSPKKSTEEKILSPDDEIKSSGEEKGDKLKLSLQLAGELAADDADDTKEEKTIDSMSSSDQKEVQTPTDEIQAETIEKVDESIVRKAVAPETFTEQKEDESHIEEMEDELEDKETASKSPTEQKVEDSTVNKTGDAVEEILTTSTISIEEKEGISFIDASEEKEITMKSPSQEQVESPSDKIDVVSVEEIATTKSPTKDEEAKSPIDKVGDVSGDEEVIAKSPSKQQVELHSDKTCDISPENEVTTKSPVEIISTVKTEDSIAKTFTPAVIKEDKSPIDKTDTAKEIISKSPTEEQPELSSDILDVTMIEEVITSKSLTEQLKDKSPSDKMDAAEEKEIASTFSTEQTVEESIDKIDKVVEKVTIHKSPEQTKDESFVVGAVEEKVTSPKSPPEQKEEIRVGETEVEKVTTPKTPPEQKGDECPIEKMEDVAAEKESPAPSSTELEFKSHPDAELKQMSKEGKSPDEKHVVHQSPSELTVESSIGKIEVSEVEKVISPKAATEQKEDESSIDETKIAAEKEIISKSSTEIATTTKKEEVEATGKIGDSKTDIIITAQSPTEQEVKSPGDQISEILNEKEILSKSDTEKIEDKSSTEKMEDRATEKDITTSPPSELKVESPEKVSTISQEDKSLESKIESEEKEISISSSTELKTKSLIDNKADLEFENVQTTTEKIEVKSPIDQIKETTSDEGDTVSTIDKEVKSTLSSTSVKEEIKMDSTIVEDVVREKAVKVPNDLEIEAVYIETCESITEEEISSRTPTDKKEATSPGDKIEEASSEEVITSKSPLNLEIISPTEKKDKLPEKEVATKSPIEELKSSKHTPVQEDKSPSVKSDDIKSEKSLILKTDTDMDITSPIGELEDTPSDKVVGSKTPTELEISSSVHKTGEILCENEDTTDIQNAEVEVKSSVIDAEDELEQKEILAKSPTDLKSKSPSDKTSDVTAEKTVTPKKPPEQAEKKISKDDLNDVSSSKEFPSKSLTSVEVESPIDQMTEKLTSTEKQESKPPSDKIDIVEKEMPITQIFTEQTEVKSADDKTKKEESKGTGISKSNIGETAELILEKVISPKSAIEQQFETLNDPQSVLGAEKSITKTQSVRALAGKMEKSFTKSERVSPIKDTSDNKTPIEEGSETKSVFQKIKFFESSAQKLKTPSPSEESIKQKLESKEKMLITKKITSPISPMEKHESKSPIDKIDTTVKEFSTTSSEQKIKSPTAKKDDIASNKVTPQTATETHEKEMLSSHKDIKTAETTNDLELTSKSSYQSTKENLETKESKIETVDKQSPEITLSEDEKEQDVIERETPSPIDDSESEKSLSEEKQILSPGEIIEPIESVQKSESSFETEKIVDEEVKIGDIKSALETSPESKDKKELQDDLKSTSLVDDITKQKSTSMDKEEYKSPDREKEQLTSGDKTQREIDQKAQPLKSTEIDVSISPMPKKEDAEKSSSETKEIITSKSEKDFELQISEKESDAFRNECCIEIRKQIQNIESLFSEFKGEFSIDDFVKVLYETVSYELRRKKITITVETIIKYIIEYRTEIIRIIKIKYFKEETTPTIHTESANDFEQKEHTDKHSSGSFTHETMATKTLDSSDVYTESYDDDGISPIAESVMGEDMEVQDEDLEDDVQMVAEVTTYKTVYEKPEAEQVFRHIFAESVVEEEVEILQGPGSAVGETLVVSSKEKSEKESEDSDMLRKKLMYIEIEVEESVTATSDASPDTDAPEIPYDGRYKENVAESESTEVTSKECVSDEEFKEEIAIKTSELSIESEETKEPDVKVEIKEHASSITSEEASDKKQLKAESIEQESIDMTSKEKMHELKTSESEITKHVEEDHRALEKKQNVQQHEFPDKILSTEGKLDDETHTKKDETISEPKSPKQETDSEITHTEIKTEISYVVHEHETPTTSEISKVLLETSIVEDESGISETSMKVISSKTTSTDLGKDSFTTITKTERDEDAFETVTKVTTTELITNKTDEIEKIKTLASETKIISTEEHVSASTIDSEYKSLPGESLPEDLEKSPQGDIYTHVILKEKTTSSQPEESENIEKTETIRESETIESVVLTTTETSDSAQQADSALQASLQDSTKSKYSVEEKIYSKESIESDRIELDRMATVEHTELTIDESEMGTAEAVTKSEMHQSSIVESDQETTRKFDERKACETDKDIDISRESVETTESFEETSSCKIKESQAIDTQTSELLSSQLSQSDSSWHSETITTTSVGEDGSITTTTTTVSTRTIEHADQDKELQEAGIEVIDKTDEESVPKVSTEIEDETQDISQAPQSHVEKIYESITKVSTTEDGSTSSGTASKITTEKVISEKEIGTQSKADKPDYIKVTTQTSIEKTIPVDLHGLQDLTKQHSELEVTGEETNLKHEAQSSQASSTPSVKTMLDTETEGDTIFTKSETQSSGDTFSSIDTIIKKESLHDEKTSFTSIKSSTKDSKTDIEATSVTTIEHIDEKPDTITKTIIKESSTKVIQSSKDPGDVSTSITTTLVHEDEVHEEADEEEVHEEAVEEEVHEEADEEEVHEKADEEEVHEKADEEEVHAEADEEVVHEEAEEVHEEADEEEVHEKADEEEVHAEAYEEEVHEEAEEVHEEADEEEVHEKADEEEVHAEVDEEEVHEKECGDSVESDSSQPKFSNDTECIESQLEPVSATSTESKREILEHKISSSEIVETEVDTSFSKLESVTPDDKDLTVEDTKESIIDEKDKVTSKEGSTKDSKTDTEDSSSITTKQVVDEKDAFTKTCFIKESSKKVLQSSKDDATIIMTETAVHDGECVDSVGSKKSSLSELSKDECIESECESVSVTSTDTRKGMSEHHISSSEIVDTAIDTSFSKSESITYKTSGDKDATADDTILKESMSGEVLIKDSRTDTEDSSVTAMKQVIDKVPDAITKTISKESSTKTIQSSKDPGGATITITKTIVQEGGDSIELEKTSISKFSKEEECFESEIESVSVTSTDSVKDKKEITGKEISENISSGEIIETDTSFIKAESSTRKLSSGELSKEVNTKESIIDEKDKVTSKEGSTKDSKTDTEDSSSITTKQVVDEKDAFTKTCFIKESSKKVLQSSKDDATIIMTETAVHDGECVDSVGSKKSSLSELSKDECIESECESVSVTSTDTRKGMSEHHISSSEIVDTAIDTSFSKSESITYKTSGDKDATADDTILKESMSGEVLIKDSRTDTEDSSVTAMKQVIDKVPDAITKTISKESSTKTIQSSKDPGGATITITKTIVQEGGDSIELEKTSISKFSKEEECFESEIESVSVTSTDSVKDKKEITGKEISENISSGEIIETDTSFIKAESSTRKLSSGELSKEVNTKESMPGEKNKSASTEFSTKDSSADTVSSSGATVKQVIDGKPDVITKTIIKESTTKVMQSSTDSKALDATTTITKTEVHKGECAESFESEKSSLPKASKEPECESKSVSETSTDTIKDEKEYSRKEITEKHTSSSEMEEFDKSSEKQFEESSITTKAFMKEEEKLAESKMSQSVKTTEEVTTEKARLEDNLSGGDYTTTTITKTSISETKESEGFQKETSEDKTLKTVTTSVITSESPAERVEEDITKTKLDSEEESVTESSSRRRKRRIVKKKVFIYHTGSETVPEDILTEDKIREAIIKAGGKHGSASHARIISSGVTEDLDSFTGQENAIEIIESKTSTKEDIVTESTSKLETTEEELQHVEFDPFSLITKPIEETFRRKMMEQTLSEQSTETKQVKSKEATSFTKERHRESIEEKDTDTIQSDSIDRKVATDAKKLAMETTRTTHERSETHESTQSETSEIQEMTSSTSSTERSSVREQQPTADSNQSERSDSTEAKSFSLDEWDKPMGLPSPPDPLDLETDLSSLTKQNTTRSTKQEGDYKENKSDSPGSGQSNIAEMKSETEKSNKETDSLPEKECNYESNNKTTESSSHPVYIDLTYVPHFGDPHYCNVEFFRRIRSRYYVFSGTKPSKEVFNALLEAKQDWKDKEAKVTIIPTYETDTLGYWMAVNQDALIANNIDVAPSASRCTINLQDHETSCSAYRLEL